jgi:hypothetical protein
MQELRLANRLRKHARATVMAVFSDARLGKAPDIEATRPIVAAIVESVLRRKGAHAVPGPPEVQGRLHLHALDVGVRDGGGRGPRAGHGSWRAAAASAWPH